MTSRLSGTYFCTSYVDPYPGKVCQVAQRMRNIITSSARRKKCPSTSFALTSLPSLRNLWTTAVDYLLLQTPTIVTFSRFLRGAWSVITLSCELLIMSGTRTVCSWRDRILRSRWWESSTNLLTQPRKVLAVVTVEPKATRAVKTDSEENYERNESKEGWEERRSGSAPTSKWLINNIFTSAHLKCLVSKSLIKRSTQ